MADDRELAKLKHKIDRLKDAHAEPPEEAPGSNPVSQAMRIGAELVAGVAAGLLLGYFLDRWLGTSPWLILAGLCLGFFAAIRNITRATENNGE